jgi:hypothetical protein
MVFDVNGGFDQNPTPYAATKYLTTDLRLDGSGAYELNVARHW